MLGLKLWTPIEYVCTYCIIAIVYDELVDMEYPDYLSYLNVSIDCLNDCEYPSAEVNNPKRYKAR
jgi:hypothetical protein